MVAFTENYRMGGGNRYLVDFVNAAAQSFDRIVVASNAGGVFPEDARALPPGTEFVALPFSTSASVAHAGGPLARVRASAVRIADPVALAANVRLLRRAFAAEKPDVVVAFNGGYPAARGNLAAVLAAKSVGAAAVLSVVGTPVPRRRRLNAYEARVDRRIWAAADAVVVNARSIERALVDLRDAPEDKIALIRNGLPDSKFVREPHEFSDDPTIGCVSRVDVEKGALDLVDAFIGLADEFPRARVRLIGEGDAMAAVTARAATAGLTERIETPGRFEGQLDPLVAQFDVYAFASHHEGFPYSILEAMRAGCPIVATRVGGVPEAVVDGVDGLIVEPDDVPALSSAIRTMLTDEGIRSSCAAHARETFVREFTLQSMSERVLRLVEGLVTPS
jgi:glycosyltransferase involved in cell wall biosynthesis